MNSTFFAKRKEDVKHLTGSVCVVARFNHLKRRTV